jgi:hypothetical protein
MNILKSIGLSLILVAFCTSARADEDPFRTDINPALLYYQALILAPTFEKTNSDYLFDNEWRGQHLTERFGELVSRGDQEFKVIRHAAQAKVPCDFGIDLSAGPMALLPHLARFKAVANLARLRAMWELQNGHPDAARDDLLGAFALAHNLGHDGTLISVLVQIAIENIVCSTVAENWYQFPPETLKQLADGFDAAPARGTIGAAIPTEKNFGDWLVAGIRKIRDQNPGNEAKIMQGIKERFGIINQTESDTNNDSIFNQAIKAGGGTVDGLINLINEVKPFYDRAAVVMSLPFSEYSTQMEQLTNEMENANNPILRSFFPAVGKSRTKEFSNMVRLAMVRAAVEYRLNGEAGLNNVMDPCGTGPFTLERFVFEGVDRGFKLTSTYDGRGFPEAMIFIEKDGPPFQANYKNVGQPVPMKAIKE